MNEKIAIAVVADFKFLNKYFKSFKDSLLNKGNFQGEILIITDYFNPTFLNHFNGTKLIYLQLS